MVTPFKYSTKKFARGLSLVMAAGIQVLAVAVAVSAFAILGAFLRKGVVLSELMVAGLIGVLVGFFFLALSSRPPVRHLIGVSSLPIVVFGVFYWLVSSSKPDLLLSHMMASFGIGAGAAALYALLFLNAPVVPRVK